MEEIKKQILVMCKTRIDHSGRVFLDRIADIKNGIFVNPDISTSSTSDVMKWAYLEWKREMPNKELAIYDWQSVPNRNNLNADYLKCLPKENINPIRVIVLDEKNSLEEVMDYLLRGILIIDYKVDLFVCFQNENSIFEGVLCLMNSFIIDGGRVRIKDDIYSLPVYRIEEKDIYTTQCLVDRYENKTAELKIYKKINLGQPLDNFIIIKHVQNLIWKSIKDKLTWKYYKEIVGGVKREWQKVNNLLKLLIDENLVNTITKKLQCTDDEAREYIRGFKEDVPVKLDEVDMDLDVMADVLLKHENIKFEFEPKFKLQWQKENHEKLEILQGEVQKVEEQLERKRQECEFITANKEKYILEIEKSKIRLEELKKEIDGYDTLKRNIIEEIKSELNKAKKEFTKSFIHQALYSICKDGNDLKHRNEENGWEFKNGIKEKDSQKLVLCSQVIDKIEVLEKNLVECGISYRILDLVASFLYMSYACKSNIMLVGQRGIHIANAISYAIDGMPAARLSCLGENNVYGLQQLKCSESSIVIVENPLNSNWVNIFERVCNENPEKFFIWLIPFIEDLSIEPKSLFDYVFPICIENIIDPNIPVGNNFSMVEEDNFQDIDVKVTGLDIRKKVKINSFKKYFTSAILSDKLERVLALAKTNLEYDKDNQEMEFFALSMIEGSLNKRWEILKPLYEKVKGKFGDTSYEHIFKGLVDNE